MRIPGRLHHATPGWVRDGSVFHIRLRAESKTLIEPDAVTARALLDAARYYHEQQRWSCRLILLMPDHVHAIIAFPLGSAMSATIKSWKGYLHRQHGVSWQEGYFDHRLRNRREEDECWKYIRENPVRAELSARDEDWPWVWSPVDAVSPE